MPIYQKYIRSYPIVLFIFLLILCYMHHVSYAYAFIGYIGNSIVINPGLKQMFRHTIGNAGNRPALCTPSNGAFDNVFVAIWPDYKKNIAYGFPSGHAQSVGYFLAFVHQFLPWRTWHLGWIVAALSISVWLMYTRIAFRRHTAVQVLFGFIFGVITFRVFHWIWTA